MMRKNDDEAFEVEAGTPTISFRNGKVERMLPYHSFLHGHFENEAIELTFQDFVVKIAGSELGLLWQPLQLQDVRCVRVLERSPQAAPESETCVVTSIRIVKQD